MLEFLTPKHVAEPLFHPRLHPHSENHTTEPAWLKGQKVPFQKLTAAGAAHLAGDGLLQWTDYSPFFFFFPIRMLRPTDFMDVVGILGNLFTAIPQELQKKWLEA